MQCAAALLATALLATALPAAAVGTPDCAPATPGALTLAALLLRGLCLDPRVAQAEAEARRTERAIDEAGASRAWQFQLQASPSLTAQQGSGGGQQSLAASGAVVASRLLADGGLTEARVAQREREALAAAADLRAARQDTLRDLAGAWADAREAQATVAAAAQALDAARASEAAVRARAAAGTATRVDLLSAASAMAQAEADGIGAATLWQRRQGVLAERLGWGADTAITLGGDDAAVIGRVAGTASPSAPPEMAQEHPQRAAQRERVLARRAALDVARADEGATLNLNAQSGPQFSRSNATARGHWDSNKRWNSEVGITWSMPLADGGARQSRTAQGQAALDAALAQQAALERSLREALWQQWTSWRSAEAEVRSAQAALAAAQAAEAAQRGRYEAGAGTLTDWITAQSDVSTRLRQAAAAEQSRLRAAFGTAHALGQLNLEMRP